MELVGSCNGYYINAFVSEKVLKRLICVYSVFFSKSDTIRIDIPNARKLGNVAFSQLIAMPLAHSAVSDNGYSLLAHS